MYKDQGASKSQKESQPEKLDKTEKLDRGLGGWLGGFHHPAQTASQTARSGRFSHLLGGLIPDRPESRPRRFQPREFAISSRILARIQPQNI